mmetsp:Transcript_9010/g.21983  ORF Transcript_9010/g.21983 Transcript_9010/m.21983 type:complete len:199 (-) Transcript_9010:533-1129(-)|eukprot:CAMPEP_0179008590 /NCGR_PEP_ID=MMETSP0795-20121207/15803_1 /TAXON_ID=88552 /ORGANISM="Amoebophrya sp., Strain Ameob2" /LENGTH=198 /DNA_ID=CAMNT_0020703697 /DNA_START=278 /DNA_END=874 /DNA_ORIENTATION=+
MAPVTAADLLGVHQVHVDGAHRFNVRCAPVSPTAQISDSARRRLPYNTCASPLEFEFLPRPGAKKLPGWVADSGWVAKKTKIHMWGKPYNGFTCEVDGDAYCAFKTEASCAKVKGQIDWRMAGDFEELCIWRRGGAKDLEDAERKVWRKVGGTRKGQKGKGGSGTKSTWVWEARGQRQTKGKGGRKAKRGGSSTVKKG